LLLLKNFFSGNKQAKVFLALVFLKHTPYNMQGPPSPPSAKGKEKFDGDMVRHPLSPVKRLHAEITTEQKLCHTSPFIFNFVEAKKLDATFLQNVNKVKELPTKLKASFGKVKASIEKEVIRLEKELSKAESPVISVFFFGPTRAGKSYIINTLLQLGLDFEDARNGGPLPSDPAQSGEGVTAYPIVVQYSKEPELLCEYCSLEEYKARCVHSRNDLATDSEPLLREHDEIISFLST
jgi:hypothetical protein